MKNLKKVLAMVLAFACTFTMFAGAKVFEDVPAGSDYSEAITMLSDLGIIQGKDDGKYHPEDTITRAEACAMIARMMTGDPNVSQYVGAQNFTDVAKGSWKDSAIGYCYINNIVIGVGNNKFEPDRAITDAEFITMVVRAMGYETPDMAQGYPYTYMSNAQAIGLLDGVNMVANTDALRGEDAQVIYNALFADYARGAKLVNTTHGTSVETYPTLAESVWGLSRAAVGEWQKDNKDDESMELTTCKAHTWVIVDEVVDKDNTFVAVPIEDETTDIYTDGKKTDNGLYYTFKYEGAADLESLKGYQVELWGSGSHNEPELETVTNDEGKKVKVYSYDWDIRAIKTVKGQTAYDYNPSMADSKPDNGTIELDDTSLDLESVADNNREKVLDITDEDGTVLDSDKRVEEAVNHKDGNTYKLIDWDSDGDVDFITVNKAYYVQVESVTSKKVVVSYLQDKNWEDETSNTKTESWDLDDIVDGNEYKVPDDLKEGDILEVTSTKAYNKSEKEVVTTYTAEVVEAEAKELTKVSTKGGLQLYFDDEVIDLAEGTERADLIAPENPDSYADFEEEEIGTGFDLYLNRNGFIVYSEYSNGDSGKYAMVLDTADGRNTAPRSLAQVDLLMADNSVKNGVEVASDLEIYKADGKTEVKGAYTEKQDAGKNAGRHFDEQLVVGNVYKVYTDEDGVITKMVEMISTDADDIVSGDAYTYNSKLDRLSVDGARNASLEDAKAIFVAKTDNKTDTDAKAGYIKYDTTTNQDNKEAGLYVDPDDVMAVSFEDMPDIDAKGDEDATAKAMTLDVNVDDEMGNSSSLTGWFHGIADATDAKILLNKDKNDEVSAAVMAVNSFEYFSKGNVTPALLTYVDVSGKGDERQVTVDLAIDGKFQTGIECVKGDDVDDIFDYSSLSDVKDEIGNGAYVEVTRNADGKITDITFMDTVGKDANGDTILKGDFFTVTRKAVAQKSTKWFSTFKDAYFANDSEMYTLNRVEDSKSWDIIDETEFYSIDGTPSIYDANKDTYKNHKMSITDGFEEELANYKNGSLKSTKINKDEVDYSVVVSSYTNNKHNNVDEYYVADIVTRNGKQDVEAVFAYDDTLEEVDATGGAIVDKDTTADVRNNNKATKIADVTLVAGGGQTLSGVTVTAKGGTDSVTGITGTLDAGASDDKKVLNVQVASTVAAGEYTAKFSVDGKEYSVDFTVKAADVAVPTFTETHKDGADQVDEVKASIEIDLAADSGVTASQDLDVQINGVDVVATSSTNTTDAYATALATAINDSTLGFDVKASASASKVTVTANDDTVKAFTVKAKTGATGIAVTTANAKEYSAEVAATNAVAELTITSGVNVASEITVTVGDVSADITLAAGDTAEQIAAKVAAASFTGYEVKADGAKVTFTSTATGASATISDVTVAAKA